MATSYYGIYLGTSTNMLDPTEGNSNNEGYTLFQNTTWGSSGAPLYANKVPITVGNYTGGADAAALESNNNVENATIATTIGGTAYNLTYDGTAIYNATLTYADGTTATVTAVLVQTTDGRLFLMPENTVANDGDTAKYEAKPITSITFGTATTFNNVNFGADRTVTAYDDGFVEGTAGDDLINGSYIEPVANGSDRIDSGDGTSAANANGDSIRAGAGNDSIYSALGNDQIYGGDGNDLIYAGVGDDSAFGDNGEDTLYGEDGQDSLDGGAGNDLLYGGASNDQLYGGADNDVLSGDAGNDQLYGGDGNDNLSGGDGNDLFYGGNGSDTLAGGVGADTFYGGSGQDYVDYSTSGAGVSVNLNTGATSGGDAAGDVIGGGVDGIIGSAYNDTLIGADVESTVAGDNYTTVIYGAAGNDYIDGLAGSDSLYGGNDNDTIYGSAGNDYLSGDAGNDLLYGGADNDQVFGGTGNDTLDGGAGNDVLAGGDGDDTFLVSGTFGNDTITGGETGETNGDILDASAVTANTTLNLTGSEAGTLTDGSSTTSFAEVERFQLGSGNDTVSGGAGNDSVDGGAGNDSMSGGAGNDTLAGGAGNDALYGGTGNDAVFGGTGNDTLDGGDGADSLYGGDGRDTFFVGAGDVVDGGEGGDDYDVLDLSSYGFRNTHIIYDPMNSENGTVEFLDISGNVIGSMTFSNVEKVIACFTPGTLVVTDQGSVAVEGLQIGDRVLTRDNSFQPIRWVGRRDLTAAELAAAPQFNPVQIAQGALGAGLPERDMQVSPQHRMLISDARAELFFGEHEVLVAAVHMVGRPGITRVKQDCVSYIHFMFDEHQVVCADGAWSESFQPGTHTLAGLQAAQRDEVLALFPELAEGVPYHAARMTLKLKEARVLLRA